MDYEKKYKEALERAKDVYTYYCDDREQLRKIESIFPELREESKDERIRKRLIEFFKDLGKTRSHCWSIYIPDILAWLEKQKERNTNTHLPSFDEAQGTPIVKQGEKKPDDKVEPKFKVGDWIVRELDNTCYQIKNCIINVTTNKYGYDLTSGGYISSQDANFYHLWTIQDAKDGDVLACKGDIKNSNGIKYERICLFKNLDTAFFTLTKTSNYAEEYDIDVNIDYPDNIIPATKEQRDILFKKMKEAGYEWDSEKLELKKVELSIAWSEEDEERIEQICDDLKCGLENFRSGKNVKGLHFEEIIKSNIDWLKSLKNRVQPQKLEWSEEDEKMITAIRKLISDVEDEIGWNCVYSDDKEIYFSEINNWFDSLKDRYTWKPSEEQMKTLNEVLNFAANHESPHWNDYIFGTLNNLIRQLKKLKE